MPRMCLFFTSIMLCGTTALARNTVPALTNAVTGGHVVPSNLFHAAAIGDRTAVMRLLANGADAKAKNADDKLPFEIAIDMNHNALVAILLKAAAGIDGSDEKGWTPLNWAVLSDDWSLVKELLSEGAKIFAGHQQNALDVAVLMQSEAELIQALITANDIDIAVSAKQAANIAYLLIHGVEVRDNGEIVADITATKKDYALAAIILKAAVGIARPNNKGWTPLHWAVLSEDWLLVRQLISEGADIFAGHHRYQQNALDIAVLMQSEAELIQSAAGVDGKNEKSWTPLLWAVLSEDWPLVQQLLSENSDIFAGHHRNALDVAVLMQSEAELLQALITANNIDIAVSAQQATNIAYLLVHGVKVRDNGEIVTDIAATKRRLRTCCHYIEGCSWYCTP